MGTTTASGRSVNLLRAADGEFLRRFNEAPFLGKKWVRPQTISTRRQTDLAAKAWALRRLKRTIGKLTLFHGVAATVAASAAGISLVEAAQDGSTWDLTRGGFLAVYALGNAAAIYAQSRIYRRTR